MALAKGQGTQTAAVVYGVTMAVNAFAWAGLWLYGSHKRRLLPASFPESERALATLLFTIGVVIYVLAVGVAFWNAYVFLGLQAAVAVYYALDPVTRRPGRGRSGSDPVGTPATGSDGERDYGSSPDPGTSACSFLPERSMPRALTLERLARASRRQTRYLPARRT